MAKRNNGLVGGVGDKGKHGTTITQAHMSAAASDNAAIEVIADNTDAVLAALDQALARALVEIGITAEGYAKKACPKDTGRLQNSITYAVQDGEKAVYIGTNVEYAPYVELGTSRRKAQPFLRPAAADHADNYRQIAERNLRNA